MPTIYQAVDDDDVCVAYYTIPDPPPDFVDPMQAPVPPDGPYRYYEVAEKLPLTGPTPTSKLKWNGGNRIMVETAPLADVAARATAAIEAAGDSARLSVIGDPTKVLEYQLAEQEARPYAAAGYPDPVPEAVASWARAKRWTNAGVPWTGPQAAADIIATADRWYKGLQGIRDLRLDAKQHIAAIAADPEGTPAQIEAVLTQFRSDLSNLMKEIAV